MCDDADDAHLVEYAAGAGGSLDDLAGMVCDHLNIDGNMPYIQSAICFVMASGSAQDFHHFLRRRGFVRRLTEILSDLTVGSSSDSRIRNVAEGLVTDCLSLLVFELCNPDAYLWLPQALQSGLLDCIARISTLWPGAHVSNLRKLLEYTQSATVYFSVVQSFACHPPTTSVRADSPIYAQWMEFLALAQERLAPADAFYGAPERGPRRVCDNLRCGRRMEGLKFKACAGCCTVYYCDSACKRADWTDNHRIWCGRLRSLHLRERLTRCNKTFMRALVQRTYHRNKSSIFRMQIAAMQAGVEHVFITQDYRTGIPVIGWQPFLPLDFVPGTDLEVQHVCYGARARRDRRIQLHLVSFPGQSPRIFMMRSSHTLVHEMLVAIVDSCATGDVDRFLDGICDAIC
ncbi:hypothetical protein B0H13DRAFT_2689712 [Mycena leptocephala]|nr:hypothetical protein B0H13DRAFT_2689712 [Mycena leptocephala]